MALTILNLQRCSTLITIVLAFVLGSWSSSSSRNINDGTSKTTWAASLRETYQNRGSKDSHTKAASHGYEAQIFSRDPLVIYLKDFLSTEEVNHLLRIR